ARPVPGRGGRPHPVHLLRRQRGQRRRRRVADPDRRRHPRRRRIRQEGRGPPRNTRNTRKKRKKKGAKKGSTFAFLSTFCLFLLSCFWCVWWGPFSFFYDGMAISSGAVGGRSIPPPTMRDPSVCSVAWTTRSRPAQQNPSTPLASSSGTVVPASNR